MMSALSGIAGALDPGPTGVVVQPGDMEWDRARAAWFTNVDQRPAAVAVVRSVADVSAVVASADRAGLRVMAQGTGHGATPVGSLQNTVLIRTSALDQVQVDVVEGTAWCGAGADWAAVSAAAVEHGLAAQAGSAGGVGVTGYLLSGGISWLSRLRGLAVNDVVRLGVVTADGDRHTVDLDHEAGLFWALRGGGGSFGVVTGIELRLHALSSVVAGTLFYPIARAGEVLHAWRRWVDSVPEHTMSCGRLLQFPPLPELSPPLRGQAFVAVEVAHQGDIGEINDLLAPLRALGPTLDTVASIETPALAALHMDPPGPTPCRGNGMLLDHLPATAIDQLVACAGHGSGSPLLSVELRQLGGAIGRRPPNAGAVGHLDAAFAMYAVGVTPDRATRAKVDAHVHLVEQALRPWEAELHYANFDERAIGGRGRFHDQPTLERLQAVKNRVDPGDLFTAGHTMSRQRPQ